MQRITNLSPFSLVGAYSRQAGFQQPWGFIGLSEAQAFCSDAFYGIGGVHAGS